MTNLAFLLSLDSFIVMVALAFFRPSPFVLLAMAATFGLADGVASYVGPSWLVVLAICATTAYLADNGKIVLLPLLCSIDNAVSGHARDAVTDAGASFALAIAGVGTGLALFLVYWSVSRPQLKGVR